MTVERLVVIGQGYVGLPIAMRAVDVGFSGVDIDACRVDALTAGESYVEDVPSGRLAAALASGRYRSRRGTRAAPGRDCRAGVDDLPRHDRGVARPAAGGGQRAQSRLADAVVLLTDHDHDDVDYELVERTADVVLDTRHRLTADHVEYR